MIILTISSLYPLSKFLNLENAEGQSIHYLFQLFSQELKQQDDTLKVLTEGDLFKPSSYHFDRLLMDYSFVNRMKDFLTSTGQQDTIIFYEVVSDYQLITTTQERYEAAEKIVANFISENSVYKLKFLKQTRESFTSKWKECSRIFCPADLFDTYYNLALDELKQVLFPKFLSSKVFKKWVENKRKADPTFYLRFLRREIKQDEHEQDRDSSENMNLFEDLEEREEENHRVAKKTCSKCGGELMDMDNVYYTHYDFERAVATCFDMNGWVQLEMSGIDKSSKVFVTAKKQHFHLDTTKKQTAVKFIGELDYSNHAVFNMWMDPPFLKKREPHVISNMQLDFVEGTNYASTIQK